MEDWKEVMKGIYRDVECKPERIFDCALTGSGEITKNAMIYLPDIMWELYLEGLIDDDEDYEIDYADEEWKEYSSLLYIYDEDEAPEKTFAEKSGMLKSLRSKITLLNFIYPDKCKVEEDYVVFPNYAFIPLYILYLQNKDFLALFTFGDKNKIWKEYNKVWK